MVARPEIRTMTIFWIYLNLTLTSNLVKLGRLPIEFPYTGHIWVFRLGDAVEIVVFLFFPTFVRFLRIILGSPFPTSI